MRDQPLTIENLGQQNRSRVLKLSGPLTISTLYEFQNVVRANEAGLILDFTGVPYTDSAGVGALVGAYVRQQKSGLGLTLAGVNDRVRATLKVTQVDAFFNLRLGSAATGVTNTAVRWWAGAMFLRSHPK